jgi:hypothetical protein
MHSNTSVAYDACVCAAVETGSGIVQHCESEIKDSQIHTEKLNGQEWMDRRLASQEANANAEWIDRRMMTVARGLSEALTAAECVL